MPAEEKVGNFAPPVLYLRLFFAKLKDKEPGDMESVGAEMAIPTAVSMGSNLEALVRELQKIWTDIGESKEDKDRMLLEIEMECGKIHQRMIEEASCSMAQLNQSLAAKVAEVATLLAVLDERTLQLKMENRFSLKEKLAFVTPLLEDLREMKVERLKQFADVRSKIEKIEAEIAGVNHQHQSPTNAVQIEENDLSIRKLTEYQSQFDSLQKAKADRLHKILECVNEVHSLCVLLGVDFGQTVASVHPSLHDIRGKPSTNISDSTLEGLSESILKLRTEKKIRREKLLDASESLLELWNQMETPDEERKYFEEVICVLGSPEDDIGSSGVLTLEKIKQMEAEVERLANLKSRRMKELVLRKRAELDEVCRTAHMEAEKSTSPEVSTHMDSGIVDPSELLANIEMQILKAKEEFMSRKDILEKVNRWLTACDEENWLEDYDQDAKKYSAGRGIHLSLKRAERARVLISKIPDMVDKLMNRIFVWEKERSMPFLYDGVSLVSILEEYKFLRLQKEELKRRYRDQKKLQNLFPTGKEAVYGTKPSLRSNSFNRKKADESGFMTPFPRRLSAGSATSELFMQRSYSGCCDEYVKEPK